MYLNKFVFLMLDCDESALADDDGPNGEDDGNNSFRVWSQVYDAALKQVRNSMKFSLRRSKLSDEIIDGDL